MILWDMPIHTDRKITANRPNIVIKDHKTKTLLGAAHILRRVLSS